MSKKVVLLAALLFAAGCTSEAPAPTQATATDPTPVQADAEPCPPPEYSATPENVAVGHAYLVRADRIYETRAGGERRRSSLELLDGDPRAVAEAVVADLVGKGFRQMDVPDRGDGTLRLAVIKKGVGRINVAATDDRGSNPAHPRSVGIVTFDWPVTAAQGASDGEAGAEESLESSDDAADPAVNPVPAA